MNDAGACIARGKNKHWDWLPDVDPSIALAQTIRPPRPNERFSGNRMQVRVVAGLLTFLFLLQGLASSPAQVACKPFLSVKNPHDGQASAEPIIPGRWRTTIVADPRYCATRSGNFEIDFVRSKDDSPDLQFTERFRWVQSQFDVSMELTPGEAILEFRIGFISPCACREINDIAIAPSTK
jgi:hypothetical protein